MSLRVLVIDDERIIAVTIREFLEQQGHIVEWAETAQAGMALLESHQPDVVLLDLELPDAKGLELIPTFVHHPSHPTSVIIITVSSDAKTAVQALKQGAWDYLVKPLDMEEMIAKLQRLERFRHLEREATREHATPSLSDLNPLHPQWRAAVRLAKEAAHGNQPICIVGEIGTGRHRMARMIHQAANNTTGLCQSWTATEDQARQMEDLGALVGAEPGAIFPGSPRMRGILDVVGDGTIILREVQALSAQGQQVLVQLLNNRTYQSMGGSLRPLTARLIMTATPDLEDLANSAPLSTELRHLLLGRHIFLPPLRDRQQDFMMLLNELVAELNAEYGKAVKGIEPAAVASLMSHPWLGNVGELKLVLSRLWPRLDEPKLLRKQLPSEFLRTNGRQMATDHVPSLAEVERAHITRVLDLCQGNQTQAARVLDIARSTLINKLKLYSESDTTVQHEV